MRRSTGPRTEVFCSVTTGMSFRTQDRARPVQPPVPALLELPGLTSRKLLSCHLEGAGLFELGVPSGVDSPDIFWGHARRHGPARLDQLRQSRLRGGLQF